MRGDSTMKKLIATSAVAAGVLSATLAAPSFAAIGNPAGESPLAPNAEAAPRGTNNVDQLFIQLVGIGGQTEVELGDMAGRKAQSDAVKQFGQRMAKDHKQASQKLERIAKDHDIGITQQADPDHAMQRKHLNDLKAGEFDKEYIRTQIAEHQRTALLLTWQIGSGQNADLKNYAADNLPIVLDHLDHAKNILNQLVTSNK